MIPNEQQSNIIEYEGNALSINSGAGTGKTSVLVEYALKRPNIPMLYVCYNEAIQKEAKKKFPANVKCITGHAMAFAVFGVKYNHKLVNNYRLTLVKNFVETKSWEVATNCLKALNNFLNSNSTDFVDKHASFIPGTSQKAKQLRKITLGFAKKMWIAAIDVNSDFPVSHDVYLKLYCLSEANLSRWFGVILFDEAQDANPVISGFILRNKCRFILVGDRNQQLYRFRNAENALKNFEKEKNADVMFMTKSFRFGPSVAQMANYILQHTSKVSGEEQPPMEGNPSIQDVVVDSVLPKELNKKHTRLHRTVQGVFDTGINNIHRKIYWIGGIEKYNLQELLDVYFLSINDKKSIVRKKLIVDYKSYEIYKESAEGSNDFGMKRIIKIIKEHGDSVISKVKLLKKNSVSSEKDADLTIGTVHRSKGLEWPFVILDDDFKDLLDDSANYSKDYIIDELNILYVAITRAQKKLKINKIAADIMRLYISNDGNKNTFKRIKSDSKPTFNKVKIAT